ncbi:PiT family inorganic phosphate transporter [Streptosporangium album]|uniref:PiT family inorganic phosphate transporter n=1 Tax=Streptosporangium album TaxID=47479 RepID=A0A7W7RRT9_9ACTN|nr:inorganic phosphate transporter [Streptosporangium album]MBB4936443.1 PiT family inorganic phosphate transporter [Streptosporangium album]
MSVVALSSLAGLFAVVTGVNDGGALLATSLKVSSIPPLSGVLVMMVMVALVPLLTHRVATTFTTRLAGADGPSGQATLAVAMLSALTVVAVLNNRGLPTSLTLAIMGALTGAGLGWGLPVSGGAVLFVLVVALAAPIVGALLAIVVRRWLIRWAHGRKLRQWHRAGFTLQCLAYAANDGQKMPAVFMLALGLYAPPLSICLIVAALFGIGALYGLPRAGRMLSRTIIASRPLDGVTAELASGAAVIGCAAIGAPVSMTQTIAGALIGAGMAKGAGRVRWHSATRIALAWALTLPASGLLAAAAALIIRGVIV